MNRPCEFWLCLLPEFSKRFGSGNYLAMRTIIHHLQSVVNYRTDTYFSIELLYIKIKKHHQHKLIDLEWTRDKIMEAVTFLCEELEIEIQWEPTPAS